MPIKVSFNAKQFSKEIEREIEKEIRKEKAKMNLELTENQIKILEMLAKGDSSTPPPGISPIQYYDALKDMDEIYTKAAFVEGEEVFSARILAKGRAYLENLAQEKRKKLEKQLRIHGADENEIKVWQWLSDNKEHFDSPENLDLDYFEAIITDMINGGYVKDPLTKDDGYKLTLKGRRQLEAWLGEKLPANMPNANSQNNSNENVELKQRILELEAKLEQKEKEIKQLKLNARDSKAFCKKIAVKILIQLLVNKTTYGKLPAKMNRATLLSRLTGFSEDALKKLTDPDEIKLTERDHGAQVREAKKLLSDGNITIDLEIE